MKGEEKLYIHEQEQEAVYGQEKAQEQEPGEKEEKQGLEQWMDIKGEQLFPIPSLE